MADSVWILLLVWLALLPGCAQSASAQGDQGLAKLSFVEEQHGEKTFSMVRIAVPTLPDFECEIWCYEGRTIRLPHKRYSLDDERNNPSRLSIMIHLEAPT